MAAQTLMIQGTGSGVGKSVVVAGLCRILKEDGFRVAPFKAQNMALNSFVTMDGLEMGRAQVYQAQAAGLQPRVEMNPVLLKPSGDNCSQVIVMGRPIGNRDARGYYKDNLRGVVREAFAKLSREFEVVILEGAGSPAEINLRDKDFVNMWMAEQADAPVVILGDIDRGGVFAWMKGTFDLLTKSQQERVKGFVINKFRGDFELLRPGIAMFEGMVGRPVLGTIPYFRDVYVDEEDGLFVQPDSGMAASEATVDIAVIALPRMSNFTDFVSLQHETGVQLRYARSPADLGNADAVVLPGSKNTIEDFMYLKSKGWVEKIKSLAAEGKMLVGICGGFQMLGTSIRDPHHVESNLEEIEGLGFFEMDTVMSREKSTRQTNLTLVSNDFINQEMVVNGYEIHMGETVLRKNYPALFREGEALGILSETGQIWGTYLHGILDNDDFRWQFVNHLRQRKELPVMSKGLNYADFRQKQFDKLAGILRQSLDLNRIYDILLNRS